jgi:tripartite-type tricarboxylate transporter receptor subunit TctC
MFKKITIGISLFVTLLIHSMASAQNVWPNKPVRVVVASAAGGTVDIIARIFTDAFAKTFGQPFVVDNKAGANGLLASDAVAKAPGDGHTILFSYAAAHVVNPVLIEKMPYNVTKDFIPVAQIGAVGNLLVVPQAMPVKDLKEFIAYVKARPADELAYSSWGNGSGGHLSMEAIKQQTGLQIRHIPYKSSAMANGDLVAGHVQVGFSPILNGIPLIKAGKLKALAVSGTSDLCSMPEVKTMSQQGVKFDLNAWYGVFVPAGTPKAIVVKLNQEINRVIARPELAELWKSLYFCEMPIKTPEQFAELVNTDLRDWGAIVKAGNIKVD